jgi:hypothetical protein
VTDGDPGAEVAGYHRELVRRLVDVLDGRLLGVYAAGSVGLRDFDATRSDLDVFAVARGRVTAVEKETIVARIHQEALPCPARGLEVVLYPEETARVPTAEAGFLLNLNTGPAVSFRVDLEPGEVERHWFPIDRAIIRQSGHALLGPPARSVFAAIPRSMLAPVVRESLLWHRSVGHSGDDDAVLNACRSLRWLREDVWSSKTEAGHWALARTPEPELITNALASRRTGKDLGRARVAAFVDSIIDELDQIRPLQPLPQVGRPEGEREVCPNFRTEPGRNAP